MKRLLRRHLLAEIAGCLLITSMVCDGLSQSPEANSDLPLHLRGRLAYWFTYLAKEQ